MSGRILVADDDPPARELLSSILRSAGMRDIVHASDGQQALALLRQDDKVDVAFLDIEMPSFTGIEVIVMAKSAQPTCRWVVVSAYSAVENIMASLNAGASGIIVKPYSINKIFDMLKRCGLLS